MNTQSRLLPLATLAVAASLVLAPVTVTSTGSAWAGAPTCLGSEATIVSTHGTRVRGTSDDDVIVVTRTGDQRMDSLTVTSGGGDDKICLDGRAVVIGNASLEAGPGDDRILNWTTFHSPGTGHVDVEVDLGDGDDRYVSKGEGTHDLVEARDGRDVVITGTGPDFVRTGVGGTFQDNVADEPNRDVVKLGGGADELFLEALDNTQADLRGANGVDVLSFYPEAASVTADLTERTMSIVIPSSQAPPTELAWPILGFDSLNLHASKARITGDAGYNHLDIQACDAVVRAGEGDDVIHLRGRSFDPGRVGARFPVDCTKGAKAYGQAGNDRLTGDGGQETLIGGEGRDSADGRRGVDTCQAETERRCELNP